MTHTKDEALKLALDALEDMHIVDFSLENLAGWNKAVTALKQALAAPVQEPVALGQEREAFEAWHDSFFVNKGHAAHHRFHDRDGYCIDEIQNQWKGWKERAKRTTPPAAQPAVPDALTSADIQEHIEYVAGWNDCRQAMLEMMK